jgi:hypothetical protein
MSAVDAGGVATRDPDLVLARLHLRLGSLALARAELETLAGRDALDEDGLLDLAEARWRTGDITGAGEAAVAALDEEEGPLLALVVAAEAAAARGRPTEARRLADKAMEAAAGSIDALFAGMPRSAVWPPDAAAPPPSPTTMFDPPRRATSPVHRHPRPHETGTPTAAAAAVALAHDAAVAPGDVDAATIGLWEAAAGAGPGVAPGVAAGIAAVGAAVDDDDLPTGEEAFDLGRAALEANDPGEAAVRLGLALRVAPTLAPAVLDLISRRTERPLAMVRGDAYRLVGREIEARRAYVDAARTVPASAPGWEPPAADSTDAFVATDHDPAATDPYDAAFDPADSPHRSDPPSEGDPA